MRQAADEVVVELVEENTKPAVCGVETLGQEASRKATPPDRYHHTLTGSGSASQAQEVCLCVYFYAAVFKMHPFQKVNFSR